MLVDLALRQSVSYIAGALGVCVAAIYYILNMRATLQTRHAQLYMYFASQMTSDTWAEHMLKIDQLKWNNLEEFNEWYNKDPRNQISWGVALNFFENAGVLVRRNLMDIDFNFI